MTSGRAKITKVRAAAGPSREGTATASAATDFGRLTRTSLSTYYLDRESVVTLEAAIFGTGAVYASANVHVHRLRPGHRRDLRAVGTVAKRLGEQVRNPFARPLGGLVRVRPAAH